MTHVCAIFTHFSNELNTLTCLQRLAQQTRRPNQIILINNASADCPTLDKARAFAEEHLGSNCLHILQMPSNLGNAGGCAAGLNYAFNKAHADFVWVLDDDSWPRPESLANLLACDCDCDTIRMSLVIDPSKGDELSWPLTAKAAGEARWQHIGQRDKLPAGEEIISRGGWLGALYPRHAWKKVGVPTAELFIRGEDEEYPWKLRQAGFQFITLRNSPLEHPSSKHQLINYQLGGHNFFYEPGLHPSRIYYKNRNWAWLQGLRYPKKRQIPLRLAICGIYILFSINAMLRCEELTPVRGFQLFRALHNGFYGKLRPY